MSAGWVAKRFWSSVALRPEAHGHGLALDGKPVRTPAKAPLVLPTLRLAEAVAAEWAAQPETIDPRSMPLTRAANSAIDAVQPRQAEVAAMIAAYGDSDLLCYRADAPRELVARQAAAWDPMLDWAGAALSARLSPVTGIMHAPQPREALARLGAMVTALGPFHLAALHDLVALSGSLVLGLAVHRRHLEPGAAWELSRIDEDWQAEQWGADAEAEAMAARKRADFLQAATLLTLLEDRE